MVHEGYILVQGGYMFSIQHVDHILSKGKGRGKKYVRKLFGKVLENSSITSAPNGVGGLDNHRSCF